MRVYQHVTAQDDRAAAEAVKPRYPLDTVTSVPA